MIWHMVLTIHVTPNNDVGKRNQKCQRSANKHARLKRPNLKAGRHIFHSLAIPNKHLNRNQSKNQSYAEDNI